MRVILPVEPAHSCLNHSVSTTLPNLFSLNEFLVTSSKKPFLRVEIITAPTVVAVMFRNPTD